MWNLDAALLAGVLLLGSAACAGPGVAPVFDVADASAFSGHDGDSEYPAFLAVTADMDLDGDPDLFINRHHFLRPELFENVGGRFELVNVPGADRSGVFENRGVPDLFADEEVMVARIREHGAAGLYLWHDVDRKGFWRFHLAGGPAAATLVLRANQPMAAVDGLEARDYELISEFELRIPLESRHIDATFGVRVRSVATQLVVSKRSPEGADAPALFVGRDRVPAPSDGLSLWKNDPHGVAWVQVEGSPEPELFLTRGGLAGKLVPPHDPKTDSFYLWQGADDALYAMADAGVIPAGYGRGRSVEWVDVDADGVLELSVGNQDTPNALLVRDPSTGAYRDRAPERGLDVVDGEAFAWLDQDADGLQDLLFARDGGLALARNVQGTHFEIVDGADLGLALPAAPPSESLFEPLSLHVVDVDADGRLDLWVSGFGPRWTHHLFRRVGDGFVDVTEPFGLATMAGTRLLLRLDVDDDGFLDAVSLGEECVLLHNRRGERFVPVPLVGMAAGWDPGPIHAGAAADVDGDGRVDLVLVGRARHLLLNRTASDNASFEVRLGPTAREPIGALVRAHYASGRVLAQRYGSADNSGVTQSLGPLRFGVPSDDALLRVGIRWPGSRDEQVHGVDPGQRILRP